MQSLDGPVERAHHLALPEDHPLSANEIIYWTDLKRERFLLSERDLGPEIQDILVAKLFSPGDLPDVVRHDVGPEKPAVIR